MYTHLKDKLEDQFKIGDVTKNFQTVMCPKCNLSFKTCLRFFSHLRTHGIVDEMIESEAQTQPKEDSIAPSLRGANEEGLTAEENQPMECKICSPKKKFLHQWKFDMHLTHYHFREKLQEIFGLADISVNAQTVTCPLCDHT